MKSNPLRIITLNTWKGDGLYQKRLELMAQGLQQLQPDIICLQESLRTLDRQMDTADYLGRKLGFEVLFGPGRLKTRTIEGEEHDCYSGLAILSRDNAVKYQLVQLPACPADTDRTALSALFDWNGLPLLITNTHLTHIPGKDALREKQLEAALTSACELYSKISKGAAAINQPVFLCCGDMNFEIDDTVLRRLQVLDGTRVHDCYIEGGGKLPGFTFEFYEKSPCRLDYVLNLQGDLYKTVNYSNAEIIFTESDSDGVMPSDHFGVLVEVTEERI